MNTKACFVYFIQMNVAMVKFKYEYYTRVWTQEQKLYYIIFYTSITCYILDSSSIMSHHVAATFLQTVEERLLQTVEDQLPALSKKCLTEHASPMKSIADVRAEYIVLKVF